MSKSLSKEDTVFYCYVLLDPRKPGDYDYGPRVHFDYEPFYAGKGQGRRSDRHVPHALKTGADTKGNRHKTNKIRKIVREGYEVLVKRTRKCTNEEASHELERQLIASIGRKDLKLGPLTNLTDGGEGTVNVALDVRRRIGRKNKAHHANMSDVEKEAFRELVRFNTGQVWAGLSPEKRAERSSNISAGRHAVPEKAKRSFSRKVSKGQIEYRKNETIEQAHKRADAFRKTMEAKPEEEKLARRLAIKEAQANMSTKARKERSQRQSDSWKTRATIVCPHCELSSQNTGNMNRWHFDNCKLR